MNKYEEVLDDDTLRGELSNLPKGVLIEIILRSHTLSLLSVDDFKRKVLYARRDINLKAQRDAAQEMNDSILVGETVLEMIENQKKWKSIDKKFKKLEDEYKQLEEEIKAL